ncbi:hypothetical protein [Cellulomonas sp. URHD0024]|uniref:hypothetical protein n=1 Tax=Cellulomonas sp. URHD0024 TaxID=1302620 RepID=UPI000686DC6C|nr:hypothetical protein [Cellulomonas sp. URHD0024]
MTRIRRNPRAVQWAFFPARQLQAPIGPPTPIVWSAFSDQEQENLLEDLELWVDWLVERYRLDHRVVPPCWMRHGELVEELSALHLAWQSAFASSATADSPLNWHEHFAVSRQRVADWVSRTGCRPDAHREPHVHGGALRGASGEERADE